MLFLLFMLGFALFGLMALAPGDIVDQMVSQQIMNSVQGPGTKSSSNSVNKELYENEQIENLKKEFALDKPFYVQYFKWLERVLIHHDLGVSLISRTPVTFLIGSRIWNSVILNLISLVFITIFSFLLGVYFSSKAGTKLDAAVTFFALFFHAFPGILLLILLQIFASVTSLFPVTAYPDFPFSHAPVKFTFSYLHHIFLPLLASFLGGFGGTMRMIRSTMLDQMNLPYIFALRSRGISEKRIYLNH
ncbi:MAG: ABC transporter permease, partial [Treponema sp.]|nr:ABC transporter permease [Treponema sp.]